MEEKQTGKIPCPVCGRYIFEAKADYGICPFCDWENDGIFGEDGFYGANRISLKEAYTNYQKYGWIYSEPFTLDKNVSAEQDYERYIIAKMWCLLLHATDLNDLREWYFKKYKSCLQDYIEDCYLSMPES